MIKYGTYNIGSLYFGSNPIGKAYLGSNLVYQKGGGGGGGGGLPVKRLQYFDTDGSNYLLSPVTYTSGSTYLITFGIQFLAIQSSYGIGWNAGGALTIYGNYLGDGAAALTPVVSNTTRVEASISIGTSNSTITAAHASGSATHTRANSSLASYAGSTGFPVGCMTDTGGTVPFNGLSMRIYSFAISKDGTTMFDAYPAVTIAETTNERGAIVPIGTVGLYDTITETFYTNRGSGSDFTPGPDYSA